MDSSAEPARASAPTRKRVRPAEIANKIKRSQVYHKQLHEKKVEASAARRARQRAATEAGAAAPPKQVPRTLDNTREVDDTVVAAGDEEVMRDEAGDEFAPYFTGARTPKLMVTTKVHPSSRIYELISEMLNVLPNAYFYKRGTYPLKKIQVWAAEKGFTHLLVLSERLKVPNGLIVVHLPEGPTAAFRMSSSRHIGQIAGHGVATGHTPELILNNFTTRIGRRVGRMVGSLFPHVREGVGWGGGREGEQQELLRTGELSPLPASPVTCTCTLVSPLKYQPARALPPPRSQQPLSPPHPTEPRVPRATGRDLSQPARLHLFPAAPLRL